MNIKVLRRCVEIAKALCPHNWDDELKSFHAAFIVRKNRIVKIGWNKKKTNPNSLRHPYINKSGRKINVYTHAELDAVLKMGRDDLSDYEIVVIRIDGQGKLNNSKPCHGCAHLLKQVNIKRVFYSTSEQNISSEMIESKIPLF